MHTPLHPLIWSCDHEDVSLETRGSCQKDSKRDCRYAAYAFQCRLLMLCQPAEHCLHALGSHWVIHPLTMLGVSLFQLSGVNVFAYVVREGRYGQLDGNIARFTTKYLFDGEEQKPNLVIVMTHCNRKQLKFSKQEKAEWLKHQHEENQEFRSLYKMVNQDPLRFFMVDNQDEEDMQMENEAGIAPLWRYILDTDSTLQWKDANILKRLEELKEEIKDLVESRMSVEELEKCVEEKETERKKLEDEKKMLEGKLASKVGTRAKSDKSSSGQGCFGGLCEVCVRNKGTIEISDLASGDMVATGTGEPMCFQPVIRTN